MDRVEIKTKARTILKENFKDFWRGYIVILLISFVCSLILMVFGNSENLLSATLSIVISFFTTTLTVGFMLYILKMIRGESYSNEDIFRFVKNVLPITVISILMTIFITLWSFLFIIPGIIAALGYSMVFYLYADKHDDEKPDNPMDYLSQSKELMKGYKLDYFVFCLSFIGWILVSVITLGLGLIYTIPYLTLSEAVYYEELKKKKELKEN